MSGYDLAQAAERSVGRFWPISKSQVYAELARLEPLGLVQGTEIAQDRRPDNRRLHHCGGRVQGGPDARRGRGASVKGRPGQPGPLVGAGRSADVYDIGQGRVLRRYHDPARSVQREAEIMSWAAAHGVPVPEVFEADGPDIVMERVDGPTMLAYLARRPWRLLRPAAVLARLHEPVHAAPGLDWLPAPLGDRGGPLPTDPLPEHVREVLLG